MEWGESFDFAGLRIGRWGAEEIKVDRRTSLVRRIRVRIKKMGEFWRLEIEKRIEERQRQTSSFLTAFLHISLASRSM
jgi:hypothetical protein